MMVWQREQTSLRERHGEEKWPVRSVIPSPHLRPFVRAYHFTDISLGPTPAWKPITARPELMLQFSLGEPLLVMDRVTGAITTAPDVVVIGRQTRRNVDIGVRGQFATLTIHFEATGLHRLFHLPMRDLTDQTPSAEDVFGPRMGQLHERVANSPDVASMVGHVEALLEERLDACRPMHVVQVAASSISNATAFGSVQDMATRHDLSVRHLERSFIEQVGVTPKSFIRINRFARALQLRSDDPTQSWADVASLAGYHDQMHLVRDCHALGDASPSALVAQWIDCRPV